MMMNDNDDEDNDADDNDADDAAAGDDDYCFFVSLFCGDLDKYDNSLKLAQ